MVSDWAIKHFGSQSFKKLRFQKIHNSVCTYGKGINTACLDSLTCQTWNYFKTLDLSLFTIVQ